MGLRKINLWIVPFVCIILTVFGWKDVDQTTGPCKILLLTMGGTKSHKIPFMALAKGLIEKGHAVTLVSGYEPDFSIKGLEEVAPKQLVEVIKDYEEYDYLGTRIRNEFFTNIIDGIKFATQTCRALVSDHAVKELLKQKFDLVIIDSYYTDCALGLIPVLKAPFMYLNTMTNFLNNVAFGGSPAPWSISPGFLLPFTDRMNFFQRLKNSVFMALFEALHRYTAFHLHGITKHNLRGHTIPHPFEVAKNVSFIMQNGHPTVSSNSPFLPNVIQIGGIHCKPPQELPKDLKDFLDGAGENGFIYVSWGTSVNPKNFPTEILKIILSAFGKLSYRIIWKFVDELEGLEMPPNVKTAKWLPQQDILGHPNIKAFVTHSGMFGTLETIYHGVPIVTLPVFADQESNAAKVVMEGFGVKLEIKELSADKLVNAINEVAANPQYKIAAMRAQRVLKDQPTSPLETAIYWTEYVIRHKGAEHFRSPARDLYWFQYYSYDILLVLVLAIGLVWYIFKQSKKYTIRIKRNLGKKSL